MTVEVGSLADWARSASRFDAAHQRAYGYAARRTWRCSS